MMGLRITQLMLSKGFGGAERLFVDLCLALADRGVVVQAICHQAFGHAQALRGHEGIILDQLVVHGNWDPLAFWRMRQCIQRFCPDVIHSHLARGARYAGYCARQTQIPLVANLHNYIDLKYYQQVSVFLPGTEDQRHYLLDKGIDKAKIQVVPHFTRIRPHAEPGAQDRQFVAYGRMVKKKGFDVLIRAFAKVSVQDRQARLILGGDGPERASLQGLVRQLGLDGTVDFAGWVDDVPHFLDRAGIFVLPSYDEPFGIVVLEAMACHKAIIASKTPGPLEMLDESLARLVSIGDVDALAHAMSALANDGGLRRQLAQSAYAHFMTRYSESAVLPDFLDVYRGRQDRMSMPPSDVRIDQT